MSDWQPPDPAWRLRPDETVHPLGTQPPEDAEIGQRFWVRVPGPDETRKRLWVRRRNAAHDYWCCEYTEPRTYSGEQLLGYPDIS